MKRREGGEGSGGGRRGRKEGEKGGREGGKENGEGGGGWPEWNGNKVNNCGKEGIRE